MRPSVLVCAVLALLTPVAEHGLEACGDKFLMLGRGTRFERPSVKRAPATIVAYAPPGSGLPAALASLPIQDALTKAGHSFSVVTTVADLEARLAGNTVDVVMLDLSDAPSTQQRLSPAGPTLLPVVFGRTTDEVKDMLKGFTCAVKSPRRNQSFLDAVDEAIDIRRRTSVSPVAATR